MQLYYFCLHLYKEKLYGYDTNSQNVGCVYGNVHLLVLVILLHG